MTSREHAEEINAVIERAEAHHNGRYPADTCTTQTGARCDECAAIVAALAALPTLPVPQDVAEVGSRWVNNIDATEHVVVVGHVVCPVLRWPDGKEVHVLPHHLCTDTSAPPCSFIPAEAE